MEAQADFRELFGLLNRHKVKYVIVGAYALAFHGAPRNTGDIDIYVLPSPANAKRILAVLRDFGFASLGLAEEDFNRPGQVVQLGAPPIRVDFLTSITGVSWERANRGKAAGKYGGIPVYYLGRSEFTANKRAIGRKKDLADLEAIGEE
jgi:hypothetical protein